MKNQVGNILIGFIILAVLAAGIILYYYNTKQPTSPYDKDLYPPKSSPSESTKSAEQTKTFQSKNLRFSLKLPVNSSANDESSRITINATDGKIYVNRNGTQYNSLDEYLDDFDKKTSLKINIEQKLNINDYPVRVREIMNSDVNSGEEKIYYIYVENWVYAISTSSEALYDDLDQIAKSFKYIP